MATVTSSPPQTSAQSSPSHRKPLPVQNRPSEPYKAWEHGSKDVVRKPVPNAPVLEDARLREPPKSPVKVNFQEGNWPQPSNANIETSHPYALEPPQLHLAAPDAFDGRDIPKTPDAPPPPPHSPSYQHLPQHQSHSQRYEYNPMEHAPKQQPAPIGRLPPLPNDSASISMQESHSAPGPHTGLDFGFDKMTLSSDQVLSPTSTDAPLTDLHRHSRDTDATASINQQHTPQSSATTSASSVSCINDPVETRTQSTHSQSADGSPESSIIEGGLDGSVPALQYHHQSFLPPRAASATYDARAASNPDLAAEAISGNRHLTPSSHSRRTSLPRPQSAYSVYSDLGPRGRSPGLLGGSHIRAPSAHSRKSPDTRPASYAELLNVPYPQPAPAPITFDNSQLRNNVGSNASLLSTQKTLEMYRQNVKKTNDFSIQYSFAVFLIATAQEQGLSYDESSKRRNAPKPVRDHDSPYIEGNTSSPQDLVKEAKAILTKLASNGYPFAQYYLADGYASGLFNKGKEDNNSAFPLFVYAAKHGHAESAYRAALCYEFGWGCRKDPAKAVQFLRTAASKRHPGAMTRLGKACLSGDLGERKYREGIKWLKLASEAADSIYNAAPYQLGCLYETGYGDDVFQDESYAAELFTQAAELGHPEANYRMGDAYEHGKLNCPRDPALSVHFYTGAAERGHAAAMMGLCAWYMVGADPILEKDEEEAYEWARRSAELGYVKAQYAVGYFTEMGIGCRRDILEANVWYVKAADAGDDRAKHRLAAIRAAASGGGTPMEVGPPRHGKIRKSGDDKGDCVVM